MADDVSDTLIAFSSNLRQTLSKDERNPLFRIMINLTDGYTLEMAAMRAKKYKANVIFTQETKGFNSPVKFVIQKTSRQGKMEIVYTEEYKNIKELTDDILEVHEKVIDVIA